MEHVILMGASGHAKVVIDILHEMSCREGIEYNIELLDDDASLQGTKIMGHKVVGKISDCVNYPKSRFLISIGNNKIRETLAKRYQLDYMTAIHPSAIIGTDVAVGEGTVIMAGAVINCGTKIGTHCIVNTGATLDHDNKISDFVHISPGVHLAGAVSVGEKLYPRVSHSASFAFLLSISHCISRPNPPAPTITIFSMSTNPPLHLFIFTEIQPFLIL